MLYLLFSGMALTVDPSQENGMESESQRISKEENADIDSDYATYGDSPFKDASPRMLNSPTESGFDHVYKRVYGLGSAKPSGSGAGSELGSVSGPSPVHGSGFSVAPRSDMKPGNFERQEHPLRSVPVLRGSDTASTELDSGSRPGPVYQALYGSVLTELQSVGKVKSFESKRRSVNEKANPARNFRLKLEIENEAESEV